jgi:hypothetical protein
MLVAAIDMINAADFSSPLRFQSGQNQRRDARRSLAMTGAPKSRSTP